MPREPRDPKVETRSNLGAVVAMTLTATAMALRIDAGDPHPVHHVVLVGAVVLLVFSAWRLLSLRRARKSSPH